MTSGPTSIGNDNHSYPAVPTENEEVCAAASILDGYSQLPEDGGFESTPQSSDLVDVSFDTPDGQRTESVDPSWYDTCPYYCIGEAVAEGYFDQSILAIAGSQGLTSRDYVQLGPTLESGGRVLRFTKKEDLTMMRVMGAPQGVTTEIGDVRADLLRIAPEQVEDGDISELDSDPDTQQPSAPSTPLDAVNWSPVQPMAYAHQHLDDMSDVDEPDGGPVDLFRDTTENLSLNGSQQPHIDEYDVVLSQHPRGLLPRESRLLRRSPSRRG